MKTGTYYLNNTGHRWVVLPKPQVKCITPEGEEVTRTALMFEGFGNWVTVQLSYKGKKKFYLTDKDVIELRVD